MRVVVLYGTESGNAELVADDLADALADRAACEVTDMGDGRIDFCRDALYLVICSTHGDGELPSGAEPFAAALDEERPDLAGVRYAMFGLGDSTYDTYSRGSELIDQRLAALGARRLGRYGRHDASSRDVPSDLAIEWAIEALEASGSRHQVLVDGQGAAGTAGDESRHRQEGTISQDVADVSRDRVRGDDPRGAETSAIEGQTAGPGPPDRG